MASLKAWIFLILALACSGPLFFFFYKKVNDLYISKTSADADETHLTLSQLLKRVVGAVNLLEELNEKVTEMLENDPFQKLVDTRVKPSYDELGSVKKQTEIYEGMARIQGGPTNFMSTAIKTVLKLETEIVETEQMYRKVVYKMTDDLASATENFENLGIEIQHLFFNKELERIGIEMPQMTKKGPPLYDGNFTFQEIMPVVSVLIPLFVKFEKYGDELNETLTEMGIIPPFQFKQVKGTPAEEILIRFNSADTDIQNVIEEHYDKLNALGPVIAGILNTMSKKLMEITPHHLQTKEKYEKLVNILDYDLVRTKERINDLKKPLKVTDEL